MSAGRGLAADRVRLFLGFDWGGRRDRLFFVFSSSGQVAILPPPSSVLARGVAHGSQPYHPSLSVPLAVPSQVPTGLVAVARVTVRALVDGSRPVLDHKRTIPVGSVPVTWEITRGGCVGGRRGVRSTPRRRMRRCPSGRGASHGGKSPLEIAKEIFRLLEADMETQARPFGVPRRGRPVASRIEGHHEAFESAP